MAMIPRTTSLLRALVLLAPVLAFVVACGESIPPRFPHEVHLTQIACGGEGQPDCLSCSVCHKIPTQDQGTPSFPKVEICARCHKAGDDDLEALTPATDSQTQLARTIDFDHARHLAKPEIKGQCVPCHAGAVKTAKDAARFPPMSKCFQCHEHSQQWDRGQCTPCHQRADLQGLMPQTFLRHDGAFQKKHGLMFRQQQKICQSCHSQAQCDDCHDVSQALGIERRRPEAIERTFVHRGDFVTRHPIEARSQPAKCVRCHTPRDCEGCHLERGVSGTGRSGLNPHPPGWVGSNTDALTFHGRAARRDIVTCAACHDQGPATNCIRCHTVGAYGGNPHPNGWKSSRGESSSMCRYCHGS